MQIRTLSIQNFRGISQLDWNSSAPFCCIIGAGDSGKSTILDAIEAALSSKWFSFSETDFLGCDTSRPISIVITIGELSRALKSDERFGLYIRGWASAGVIRDEPESDDEPVLTVRLTVDAALEPTWELVCDRLSETRTLSNRDRALFGLVRLAGEDSRHLTWGQGSVLSKLTGDTDEASVSLAQAYRAARDSAGLDKIEALTTASATAEGYAKGMGAYVEGAYGPGLELGRSGISSNVIALHDNGVPLRLAGLGTRKLATLAIQKSAILDGGVVLIDEIEHGLEPHRIIGAISQLKVGQNVANAEGKPVGQIIITTHSDVALGEVGTTGLFVCQIDKLTRVASLIAPKLPDPVRALLRFNPRSLFGRRILLTEGMTEVGLILGLRESWLDQHGKKSIEQQGSVVADGNGTEAPARALALAELGFKVAIFRDSDKPLTPADISALEKSDIEVFEYRGSINTEQAILSVASDVIVQRILDYMRADGNASSFDDSIFPKILGMTVATVRNDFASWASVTGLSSGNLRELLAEIATRNKWFKDSRVTREIAPIVWAAVKENPACPMAVTLSQIEAWLYA